MTTSSSRIPPIEYPQRTVDRAARAFQCAPFRLNLFQQMRSRSVPIGQIASQFGVDNQYTAQNLSELKVENELTWLIQVGLLRREVDGQGITDSFRLTPLGRQLAAQWEQQTGEIPSASLLEQIRNAIARWLRLPI